jgi:hypothetical protein
VNNPRVATTDDPTVITGEQPPGDDREQLSTEDIAGSRPSPERESPEPVSTEEPVASRVAEPNPSGAASERPAESVPTEDITARVPARPETPASTTPLFDEAVAGELRERWDDVQTAFVDEPRAAVERADQLVADVMQRLADGFANERRSLEDQWSKGDDVSTEDLRIALQRYRSFFDRLLAL